MDTLRNLWRYAMLVSRDHGKSIPRQAMEIARLRFGPGKIGLTEYYDFELFDDSLFTWNHRSHYIGNRTSSELERRLNIEAWAAVAYDKIVNYQILARLGLPIPAPIATYNRFGRHIGSEPILTDVDSLFQFLHQTKPYPFYLKPVHGYCGIACLGIQSVDCRTGEVGLITGDRMARDVLIGELLHEPHGGMLLQSLLRPPSAIAEIFGERLSSFRVITLLTDSGPKVHTTIWKLARFHNMTDNFQFGKHGNMQGLIDQNTGRLERVVGGLWPNNQEILDHPETGRRMVGFTIPHWNRVLDVVRAATVHFPGIKIQNWDVALSEDGPVLIELNTNAGFEMAQMVTRKPFMDADAQGLLSA